MIPHANDIEPAENNDDTLNDCERVIMLPNMSYLIILIAMLYIYHSSALLSSIILKKNTKA